MSDARSKSGWAYPLNSRKFHFFVDGRSLCRKWMFFGELQADNGKSTSDDCAACSRRFQSLADKGIAP